MMYRGNGILTNPNVCGLQQYGLDQANPLPWFHYSSCSHFSGTVYQPFYQSQDRYSNQWLPGQTRQPPSISSFTASTYEPARSHRSTVAPENNPAGSHNKNPNPEPFASTTEVVTVSDSSDDDPITENQRQLPQNPLNNAATPRKGTSKKSSERKDHALGRNTEGSVAEQPNSAEEPERPAPLETQNQSDPPKGSRRAVPVVEISDIIQRGRKNLSSNPKSVGKKVQDVASRNNSHPPDLHRGVKISKGTQTSPIQLLETANELQPDNDNAVTDTIISQDQIFKIRDTHRKAVAKGILTNQSTSKQDAQYRYCRSSYFGEMKIKISPKTSGENDLLGAGNNSAPAPSFRVLNSGEIPTKKCKRSFGSSQRQSKM